MWALKIAGWLAFAVLVVAVGLAAFFAYAAWYVISEAVPTPVRDERQCCDRGA